MPLRTSHFQTDFDDFQTAENVLAQAEMEGLPPEAFKVFQDTVEEIGFERRDVAAKKEDKQYVLQGQLLVLGDPRNGKTSLVKAMTGEEFDPEENQTSGVEFKFVDRIWETLDLQNLKFGDFNKYSKKIVCKIKLFPRIFNEDSDEDSSVDAPFWLFMGLILLVLVLPILLGAVVGESNARWLIYFIAMTCLSFLFCIGKGTVTILLMLYFQTLAMYVVCKLFGCSDEPVAMRLSSYLNHLVTADIIPLHVMNPMIFFVLEWFSLVCIGPIFCLLQNLLFKLPMSGTLLLNFVFRYREEVLQPVVLFFNFLIFFAPIGLSCYRSSTVFPFECIVTFLMHIALLHHQNILKKTCTLTVLFLELSIFIPLCFTELGSRNVLINIISNIIMLSLGVGLHVHGKWLEFKDDFNGKSFTQVVLYKDFLLHVVQVTKALIDMKRLKNALNEKFSSLKLKILDFAGDEDYYAYHQIFLNSNALYVVVFDIQECIKDNFKDIESRVKRLRLWLESIYSHVPQGTPIFLVGTHRANIIMDTLKVINSHIRKAVWHTPFNESIIVNNEDGLLFFHVENSRGLSDNGILTLREKIRSVAEDEFKGVIGQEIPLSWIKIQDAIIRYLETKEGPVCLTVDDFKKHFEHLYIEWNVEMLKYFHKKGFIIYLDKDPRLSNWVLLKPDVLVQAVVLLINPPDELANERGKRGHWQLLKKRGTITKTLMRSVLSHVGDNEESSLTTFLEEYDLLCPLRHPSDDMQNIQPIKQTTHFVPSLLPMPSDLQNVWVSSEKDKKFYIFFNHFLPEALFYRILSRASKLTLNVDPDNKLVIYRDKGLFWLSPDQPYCLRLLQDEGQIEVTFSPKDTDQQKPYDILVLIAVSIVESICKRDFQNLSKSFHCGPECTSPKCPGFLDDSLSHFAGQRRRHVIDVYPTQNPRPFKCLNFCPEDEAHYWLPSG